LFRDSVKVRWLSTWFGLAGISTEQSVEYNTTIGKNLLAKFPDEIAHI